MCSLEAHSGGSTASEFSLAIVSPAFLKWPSPEGHFIFGGDMASNNVDLVANLKFLKAERKRLDFSYYFR